MLTWHTIINFGTLIVLSLIEKKYKPLKRRSVMSAVMILFAFSLSLVINFVQKMIHPEDDAERTENLDNYAVEETE